MHVHDMRATLLYLLGLDQARLTYRYGGRDFRLTDTGGVVAKGAVASYRRRWFSCVDSARRCGKIRQI